MEKMIGIKKNITDAEDNLSHCCPPIRRRKGGLVSKRLRKGAFLQEKMPKQLELTDWYFQKTGAPCALRGERVAEEMKKPETVRWGFGLLMLRGRAVWAA